MQTLYSKLGSVDHNIHTISPTRNIEKFYERVFCAIFGAQECEEGPLKVALKNKMQLFLLSYALCKGHCENFTLKQQYLDSQLNELENRSLSLSYQDKNNALGSIVTNFLKDILSELEGQGNEYILKNIIGGNWFKYISGEKKDFFEIGDFAPELVNGEQFGVKKGAEDILKSEGYREAKDKAAYLREHEFSYKRGIELYYNKVRSKCFLTGEYSEDEIEEKMQQFNIAYIICKYKFQDTKRSSGERYFDHLLAVLDLYLEGEEQLSFEGAMIAMLHDIYEDSDIDKDTLKWLFGEEVAHGVVSLSKTSVYPYLQEGSSKEFLENEVKDGGILNRSYKVSDDTKKGLEVGCLKQEEYLKVEKYNIIHRNHKKKRNKEYFRRFRKKGLKDHLSPQEKRDIRIKCYDRIHNTSTLKGFGSAKIPKILQKLDETVTYFLPVTYKHLPDIHQSLILEMEEVLTWLGSQENTEHYIVQMSDLICRMGGYKI